MINIVWALNAQLPVLGQPGLRIGFKYDICEYALTYNGYGSRYVHVFPNLEFAKTQPMNVRR